MIRPPLTAAIRFGVLGAAVALALALTAPAFAAYGPPGAPSPNPAVAVPLAGAVTTASGTWATVVMGKNDGEFNLFWQLFHLDSVTGRLTLATPPGVADNGGLMVAPATRVASTLVGFGASQGLKFSPLARTGNGGQNWSQGGLPDALFAAPSVLSLDGSETLALVSSSSGQVVLSNNGDLTTWRTLVTKKALSATPAGATCGVGTMEAVAFDANDTPLVGVSCRQPDTPGILVDSDRQWHLADIPVPNSLIDAAFATLRLSSAAALFLAVRKHSTDLLAAWAPSLGRPWVVSPPLPITKASDLVASGTGSGSSQFVLVRSGGELRALTIAGPGANWHALPALPARTATVAIAPSGAIDALTVDVTKLSVWRLDPAHRASQWIRTQTITVPIVFGSSA